MNQRILISAMADKKLYTVQELEEMIAAAYKHGCDDTFELVIDYLKNAKKNLKDGFKKIKDRGHVKH